MNSENKIGLKCPECEEGKLKLDIGGNNIFPSYNWCCNKCNFELDDDSVKFRFGKCFVTDKSLGWISNKLEIIDQNKNGGKLNEKI